MNKKIQYDNANVWLAAQKRYVELKDSQDNALASSNFLEEKIAEDTILNPETTSKNEIDWLQLLVSHANLAV